MSKKLSLLSTALLIATAMLAQQDTSTHNLDEVVVVTANKVEQKQSSTGKVVTVITEEQIRESAGRTLTELLNTQAGLVINGANNTMGTNQELYFRGATTGKTLIVVDGIPVSDPSQINNSFDLTSIPLQQIERIEILKGGQSTVWGSDAVAGVIQIFLKKEAKGMISPNASFSYGTYNTSRLVAGLSGTISKLGYKVQWNRIKSDGFSSAYDSSGKKNFDNDGFEQNNVQTSLSYQLTSAISAKAFGNFSTYTNGLDGGAFKDDKDYTAKNKNNMGGVTLTYKGKGYNLNLQGSYQQAKRTFVDDSIDVSSVYSKYQKGNYEGKTSTIEAFGNTQLAKHLTLVGGLQYITQNSDQSYLSIGSFGPYSSALGKDSAKTNQVSAYASLLLADLSGFNLEVGGRVNNQSIFGNNATFTFNPSYNIDENTKIFANISSAYKTPSLYQLFVDDQLYIQGNKDLKPETSTTYEMGIQTNSIDNKLYLRIVGFMREINNLITTYTDANYKDHYINQDKQNDYGFEVESNVKLAKFGKWANNFSFVDGQGNINNMKVSNLYRRPNFVANSSLSLTPYSGITLMPSLRYVGTRLKGQYDAGPAQQPSYYTIDCYLGYQLLRKTNLFIDFRNITNQQYFEIVGYNSKRFNMMAGVNIEL